MEERRDWLIVLVCCAIAGVGIIGTIWLLGPYFTIQVFQFPWLR